MAGHRFSLNLFNAAGKKANFTNVDSNRWTTIAVPKMKPWELFVTQVVPLNVLLISITGFSPVSTQTTIFAYLFCHGNCALLVIFVRLISCDSLKSGIDITLIYPFLIVYACLYVSHVAIVIIFVPSFHFFVIVREPLSAVQ